MRIGLYNLEPKIINSAMMQVSTHYKKYGHEVELYDPNKHYDLVYCFSLFTFTDKSTVPPYAICGGTGFDIHSRLPAFIEECDYDWSLYPDCDFSMLWFSRGCVRHCSFCIVQDKEGMIHPVKPKNLNPNGKYVKIMDNNFFENPEWEQAIKYLQELGQPVDFHVGIDIRTLKHEQAMALRMLKHKKRIKIAWDNPKDNVDEAIRRVLAYRYETVGGRVKPVLLPYRFMCYVLVGYNSTEEEDLYRIETLRSLGVDPFVMKYDSKDEYQVNLARWCNRKEIFRNVKWADYSPTYRRKANFSSI